MVSLLGLLRDFLWPSACPGCLRDLPAPGFCEDCQGQLVRLAPEEAVPLDLTPLSGLCAPFRYEGLLRGVVLEFKYAGATFAGPALGELLAGELEAHGDLGHPDVVVPVPLSRRRRRERGFNQASLLARPVAGACGLSLLAGALRRPIHRPAQASLGGRERRRNLPRASYVARGVCGRAVLLVDDVVTTGSTLRAAAQALVDAGARRVTALCLCRARPD